MNFLEILVLAVGLSMDAFAVAACAGLTMPRATVKKAVVVGLYFGVFQAVMPLIGFWVATVFADMITAFDHWIAFGLLCFLGVKMIIGSFKKEKECSEECSLKPQRMLPLAVATSIDALAVGVSLAFLRANIAQAAITIGIVTFALSILGVKIGSVFGTRFKSKAELAGGIILILIGCKILIEHLL